MTFPGPPTILYLMDELKIRGGSEKHLLELATGMARRGCRVSVFSLADGPFAEEFKGAGLYYECLNVEKIYGRQGLWQLLRLARFIRRSKVQIVQTFHTASDLMGPVAARLAGGGVRVISSRRDLGYTKSPRHLRVQKVVNRLVDGILANSEAVKSAVLEKEGESPDRISVIYNGIETGAYREIPGLRLLQRGKLGLAEGDIAVGSVGNMRPVKGYRMLVEAAHFACRRSAKIHFFHIGDGSQMQELSELCRTLGLQDRFHFMGKRNDVPALLSALDVYVQPSLTEGFSNSILESMVAGLPVIASSVGGNKEMILHNQTGILYAPLDVGTLADHIVALASDGTLRRSLGRKAAETALERYDLEKMLDRYAAYYETKGASHE